MLVIYRLPGLHDIGLLPWLFYNPPCCMDRISITLPGVGGIILAIGMGVDANCVILNG